MVADLYLPNRLHLSPDGGRLDMSLAAVRLGQVTIGRLGYGQDVRLVTDDAASFHVNAPLVGKAMSVAGHSEAIVTRLGSAAVFSPGAPADIQWSEECVQMCLMVPQATLETELEELTGRNVMRPLRFRFAMDIDSPVGRSWLGTLQAIARELHDGLGFLQYPHTAYHLERLVLDGLLLGQPHSYSDDIIRQTRPGSSDAIAKALELLHERAHEPWSSTSLAREVHLSVRALEEGFKRDVAKPPMRYLRDLRLRRVNAELRASAPGSTTVGAVASRWGFVHMGRFAATYRAAFGELPSDTLSR